MSFNWRDWLVTRFGWQPIQENFLDRRVPKTPWYYGDGSTLLLLLGVQVLTGATLSLTYSPTPETAYESVRSLTHDQILGHFVRALHYWSAGLMVVMLFFHVFRIILVAGYKAPREGTWLIGTVMFFLILLLSYTGYMLRWDQRAVHGIQVSLHMFHRVPLIGDVLVRFVQGGSELGATTLTRFYSVHVIWAPLTLLALAGYHLYLVVVCGITSPAERRQPVATAEEQKKLYKQEAESEERGEKFHPSTTWKSGAMAMSVFAVAAVLAIVVGAPELMADGNRVEASRPAEEWWFWWYSGLIALLPAVIAPVFVVVFPILLFVAMVALPFWDRSPQRGIRKRPFALGFVILSVIALLYLSDLRRQSPWTGWPNPNPPPVPAGVELPEESEEGRQLFARYGCNSCHAVAGHGPRVGTDLATLQDRYSEAELRNYILQPPEDVPMPSYEGRMSEEELGRLVGFVLVAQTFPQEQ